MNNLFLLVLATWERALGERAADESADFFDAGGDSLAFLQLTVTLEERTGVRLPVADVLVDPTPAGITALLRRRIASSPAPGCLPDPGVEP